MDKSTTIAGKGLFTKPIEGRDTMRGYIERWLVRVFSVGLVVVFSLLGMMLVLFILDSKIDLTNSNFSTALIAFVLASFALTPVARFGFPSVPYTRMYPSSFIALALTALKIVAFSSAGMFFTLSAFNPISDSRLYIYIDDNPSLGGDSRQALGNALISQREQWVQSGNSGQNIFYLPGEISIGIEQDEKRRFVQRMSEADVSQTTTLVDQFLDLLSLGSRSIAGLDGADFGSFVLQNLQNTLNEIEATGRAGDQFVVLSTWRTAPDGEKWALNSTRFGSTWIQVSGGPELANDSPHVQSVDAVHFPGLQPSVSFLIRSSDLSKLQNETPVVFLTAQDNIECRDQTPNEYLEIVVGGPRTQVGSMSTGYFEGTNADFFQVRLVLPTSAPEFLCVDFPSLTDLSRLTHPIYIGVRQLGISASPQLNQLISELVGPDYNANDLTFSTSPLVEATPKTNANDTSVAVVHGGVFSGEFRLKALPEKAAVDTGYWQLDINRGAATVSVLEALRYFDESKERLEGHLGAYEDAPQCDATSIIKAVNEITRECRTIMRSLTSGLELWMPPQNEISSMASTQKLALRSMLLLAAVATWSAQDANQLRRATSLEVYSDAPNVAARAGWESENEPLWLQLVRSIKGEAPSRQARRATNSSRSALLLLGLSMLLCASIVGIIRPIFLMFSRLTIKNGESE